MKVKTWNSTLGSLEKFLETVIKEGKEVVNVTITDFSVGAATRAIIIVKDKPYEYSEPF